MTFGNMRANGVRSLAESCSQCHHEGVMSAGGLQVNRSIRNWNHAIQIEAVNLMGVVRLFGSHPHPGKKGMLMYKLKPLHLDNFRFLTRLSIELAEVVDENVEGTSKIEAAGNRRRLWGEQHGIKPRTKRNHLWANPGCLTSEDHFSRSP
jgi:hypothetical protein